MSGSNISFGNSVALVTQGQQPPPDSFVGDAMLIPLRAISTIIPNVMIEEVSRDDLEITLHPVAKDSPITDHAFMRPVEITMRVGWSNSGQSAGYIQDVYAALQSLQRSRAPFDVFTSKRLYHNMLMAGLVQTTNGQSGDFTLMVQATLREIIIVGTSSANVPSTKADISTTHVGVQHPVMLPGAINDALNTQTKDYNNVAKLPPVGSTGSLVPTTIGGA